jgi:hypothetical protein
MDAQGAAATPPPDNLPADLPPHVFAYVNKLNNVGIDLSIGNSTLYWAKEATRHLLSMTPTPEHQRQLFLLEIALDLRGNEKKFFKKLDQPNGIADTANVNWSFWIQYNWLACTFINSYADELKLEWNDPDTGQPISNAYRNKTQFWRDNLSTSPLPVFDDNGFLFTAASQMVNALDARPRD